MQQTTFRSRVIRHPLDADARAVFRAGIGSDELEWQRGAAGALGCEYIGHTSPGSYDRVVIRGKLADREFVAFWVDSENHIQAAMNVNVWDVVDEIKPLIAGHVIVDPEKLTDPEVAYAQL